MGALEGPFSGMDANVSLQIAFLREGARALGALVGSDAGMHTYMDLQVVALVEGRLAMWTLEAFALLFLGHRAYRGVEELSLELPDWDLNLFAAGVFLASEQSDPESPETDTHDSLSQAGISGLLSSELRLLIFTFSGLSGASDRVGATSSTKRDSIIVPSS